MTKTNTHFEIKQKKKNRKLKEIDINLINDIQQKLPLSYLRLGSYYAISEQELGYYKALYQSI